MTAKNAVSLSLANSGTAPLSAVPLVEFGHFRKTVLDMITDGARVCAFFGFPDERAVSLVAVLARDEIGELKILRTTVGDGFAALTPDAPQVHWFEREIAEQWGIRPEGHPWPKPLRFHRLLTCDRAASPDPSENDAPGVTDYFRVAGDEIHEVAVGPVHAGVIEPGHFRFQCHGEQVLHLEISLGYQHRGIEAALRGGPDRRTPHYMETLAGDTTVGHATAYAMTVEALSGAAPSARAEAVRAIALELERLANHTGDLGALANDVGFLPTAAYCGRIRGDFLNMTALVCGNRFGRALIRPGGVRFDIAEDISGELAARLLAAERDVTGAVNLLWDTPSVMARFEDTGRLTDSACVELGLVGPPARACGLPRDVRSDFPFGAYRDAFAPPGTARTGDVFARAQVRWLEIRRSLDFIRETLRTLPALPPELATTDLPSRAADSLTVNLVEGWRGEICHVAVTDGEGRFRAYKIVDPSFHNWFGLAVCMRNQQISDFPLCNKSFNLSYCGHDL